VTDWSTACPDWRRRIVAGESLIPCPPLFPDQAEEGVRIFSELRAVDVIGSPKLGEISRAWVTDLVATIFGSLDARTGRRLIREIFLLVAKKNGKSTDAAGIMLTALLLNMRTSGEMGILAPTIEVANNAWRPARDAIKADEELSDLLHVQDHIRTITHRSNHSTLQVVAADSETVAGKKWIVTLIDELWLFGKRPNADRMLLEATGGMASRPEGFVMYSSTMPDEPPAGVFKEKLHYARQVRDGTVHDPAFLPVLYEFPPEMIASGAARDLKNAYVTNPNLGASVDEEFLARELKKAEIEGEGKLRIFLAKHLNIEIGMSLAADRWAGADYWEQQAREPFTLSDVLEQCEVVECGIDGGGLDDLLGFAAVGRTSEGKWMAWTKAWAHPSVLERRKSEAARFKDFQADGDLVFVEQIGDDVAQVAALVAECHQSGLLDKVGVDPHGLGGILDALSAAEVPEDKVIGISQGWKMAGSIKTAERKLAEGTLIHGGQRMMNWCVGNAKITPQGNAVSITKQASGTAKIDPLLAVLNAVTLLALNPAAQNEELAVRWL
jgi:phage terminase large subunit-like protein